MLHGKVHMIGSPECAYIMSVDANPRAQISDLGQSYNSLQLLFSFEPSASFLKLLQSIDSLHQTASMCISPERAKRDIASAVEAGAQAYAKAHAGSDLPDGEAMSILLESPLLSNHLAAVLQATDDCLYEPKYWKFLLLKASAAGWNVAIKASAVET
ncbi:MAG: hypothetical protein HOO67_00400 [Candidatus Peribacteraceae bacterium]|nr:hypothetical protein [Candidatus Peribacteraceae bacterium]